MKESPEIINILINHGIDINQTDRLGRTALHISCKNGNLTIVTLLLNNNANLNIKDSAGNTPLDNAIEYDYEIIVKKIKRHKAELENTKTENE